MKYLFSWFFMCLFLIACPQTLLAGPAAAEHHHQADQGHMAQMNKNRLVLQQKLGAKYDVPVRNALAGELQAGQMIYKEHCAHCHGANGQGDGPNSVGLTPPAGDFTDRAHASYYSDQARLDVIRNGSPETAMPAWSGTLSEDQVMSVYQFVRSLRPAENKMQATSRGVEVTLGFPKGIPDLNEKTKLSLEFINEKTQERVNIEDVSVKVSMPGMGHNLAEKTAIPQGQAGLYSVSFTYPMMGRYRADISGSYRNQTVEFSLQFDIGHKNHAH